MSRHESDRREARPVRALAGIGMAVAVAAAVTVAVTGPPPAAALDLDQGISGRPAFRGSLVVAWTDGTGQHTETLQVNASPAGIRVTGPAGRGVLPWPVLPPGVTLPRLERKYEVVSSPGPEVASRPTLSVALSRYGVRREQLYVDTATGLVLAQEDYDAQGVFQRDVRFSEITMESGRAPARRATAGPGPRLPGVYPAPDELPGGYSKVATIARGQGVQVLYSDGLHGLSVFQRAGQVSGPKAPGVTVGRQPGVSYSWVAGEALAWQNGPTATVVVGDGPPDEVLAAARGVPAAHQPSPAQRIRHGARQLLDLLTGGST